MIIYAVTRHTRGGTTFAGFFEDFADAQEDCDLRNAIASARTIPYEVSPITPKPSTRTP